MYSVGIDLVEISRIENSMKKSGFLERFFGAQEIVEFKNKGYKPQSVAACFAAKEAFSKAVETGLNGFCLCDVQMLHFENGAPFLLLSGEAESIAKKLDMSFKVSVTHTKDLAQAIVIGCKNKNC